MKRAAHRLLLALSVLVLPALAPASTWDIDPAHTRVGFKVRHMMVTNVRGEFHEVKGTLELDETDVTRSAVDVTIQAASIDTGVEKRDAHLRSPDFFDAEKFPTLTFQSREVSRAGTGQLKVKGALTIHGVTRDVVLEVDGPTGPIADPSGNQKMGASAVTTVNRKDFGLLWNKALEAGGWVVGDEVAIELDIEWVKRKVN